MLGHGLGRLSGTSLGRIVALRFPQPPGPHRALPGDHGAGLVQEHATMLSLPDYRQYLRRG